MTTNQNNRILALDLARGLAVVFMIAVHTLEVYASPEVKNSVFGSVIGFLGGPAAAPVFMTLMGFSFAYAPKHGLKAGLIRGLTLFMSGYALNFFRGVLPFYLATWLDMDVVHAFPAEKLPPGTLLTIVDILQFAAIATVVMAVLQALNVHKYLLLVFAGLIAFVSPWLWGIRFNLAVLDFAADLFWGHQPLGIGFIDNKIAFPVFPWLTFPLMGMFLGSTVKGSPQPNLIFRYIGLTGALVLLMGLFVSFQNPDYHFNDYYHSRQGGMLFMCGFVLVWLYGNKLLIDSTPMNMVFNLLFKWSKEVTTIYFIQWLIIIWSISIFGSGGSSFIVTFSLMVGFLAISHYVSHYISGRKKMGIVPKS